jgi:hypothetical protein
MIGFDRTPDRAEGGGFGRKEGAFSIAKEPDAARCEPSRIDRRGLAAESKPAAGEGASFS